MYIKVRVVTDAPKEVVQTNEDGIIEMYLREPAERNLANKRAMEIVRIMHPGRIARMIKGHRAPSKTIELY
jgi:uncharacterized protein YggU (UPF0235/DUF167 family)